MLAVDFVAVGLIVGPTAGLRVEQITEGDFDADGGGLAHGVAKDVVEAEFGGGEEIVAEVVGVGWSGFGQSVSSIVGGGGTEEPVEPAETAGRGKGWIGHGQGLRYGIAMPLS